MSERIIIDNQTDLPMSEVLSYVRHVIRQGRISQNDTQYCYVTTWTDEVIVFTGKNKKSDRFVVTKEIGGKDEE